MQPESTEQLIELIRDSPALTVHRRGADGPTVLGLSKLNQIVDDPAADMTITVETGVTVEALQQTLAEHSQHLPIDIPNPDSTTIGDAVAWNLSGSRRFGYGTFRDYVIGIEAVDGRGRRFKSGGRVVKNVAGYDLCKLLIGSHGTLAAITQLTFKVLPQPAASGGVTFRFADFAAIDAVLEKATTSATRPRVIDITSDGTDHELMFAFDGTANEVAWQQETIQSEIEASGTALAADGVTTHLEATTKLHVPVDGRFVAGVRPSIVTRFLQQLNSSRVVAHAGNGIVVGEAAAMHAAISMAEGLGGWCRRNDDEDSFVTRANTDQMDRVRAMFDPENRFTPRPS